MRPNVFELLNKINEMLLSASVHELSKLEFDLLKQNIQMLYEQVMEARNDQQPGKPISNQAKEINEPEIEIRTEYTKVEKEVFIQPKVKVEQQVSTVSNTKEEPDEVSVKKAVTKQLPGASINDTVTGATSLNEKLKVTRNEMHKLHVSKPLKDQIDLNKRVVLVKELFSGSNDAFAFAIEKIDSFVAFSEADTYIKMELADSNKWDITSQTARMFMKLVRQRFGEE